MGLLSVVLGIIGFGFGLPLGLLIGFYFFIYSDPKDVKLKEPIVRPLHEFDSAALHNVMPEIPLWVKNPDYDRVDWLNKFVSEMWPYLDKAICGLILSTAQPIFADYIGKNMIGAIEFENLSLGTLPPVVQGLKVYETNERELVMEPAIKWAGSPNIIVALKLISLCITIQLVDLQVFALPRVTLKPLVPAFPCFSNVVVSLMEKPCVDFGFKVLGGDVMSIPGLYRLVQDMISKQVASLYLWPKTLELPVLDASISAVKKSVGVLHVRVIRAVKLMKMDLLGLSDPYVKLSLSGERLPAKKTTVKKKTLNPEWNENFNLIVREPQSQLLHIHVYDWDKVGAHDRLGMQVVPLQLLVPNEAKELTLELLKDMGVADSRKQQQRGQIVVELMYAPFKDNNDEFSCPLDGSGSESPSGAGVLMVSVQGAEDVEGERHNNPYALVLFRGEKKKSKMMRKTRDPVWNEEFQFMLDEPPINDKIRVQVVSRRTGIGFRSKESLGHVEINLTDVVRNGRINEKYHLIDSKNGVIHIELRWKTTR